MSSSDQYQISLQISLGTLQEQIICHHGRYHYIQKKIPCKNDLIAFMHVPKLSFRMIQALSATFTGQKRIIWASVQILIRLRLWFHFTKLVYEVCTDIEEAGGNAEHVQETLHKALKRVRAILDKGLMDALARVCKRGWKHS